ncbi:MAG: hypothetical protein Q8Q01_02860 [archaeon]|nr:hypothetical protein [archaeon]
MQKEKKILAVLFIATALVILFNAQSLARLEGITTTTDIAPTSKIIPTGVPEVYGKELSLRYDDVSPQDPARADLTIRKLGQMDRTLSLEGEKLDRYINILYQLHNGISCEYCCGARSIIFENGEAACGCAHSYAMRGLAKYLLLDHGSELTDEQILEEIGKWKVLFFPGQMQLKAGILEENEIEFNYINLASNRYRGIEDGQSAGGMVGGC